MVQRVGGLASGIDTDSIIKELMTSRRAPVNKLVQKKQVMEWQREDYRSMNSKILEFRNSKVFDFKKEGTVSEKKVAASGATGVVTASANASSVTGTYNIEVSQLATTTTRIADPAWETTQDSSAFLSAGLPTLITGSDNKVKIKVNGTEFTFDKATDTLDSVISQINSNPAAKATLYYDSAAQRISVTSKETGSTAGVIIEDVSGGNLAQLLFNKSFTVKPVVADGYAAGNPLKSGVLGLNGGDAGNYTINVNGADVVVSENDTMTDLITKMASQGVTMTYNAASKTISIDGGTAAIKDVKGNLAAKLFNSTGQDALVKINGISSVQSSNTFKVNGLDLTLNGLSPSNGSGGVVASTIEVKSDVDKIVENIKNFIEDYNSILKTLTDKINENKYRSFTPLTTEQKANMKDKEIELWESKAKSGQLKNDSILSQLVNEMRNAVVTSVNTGSTKYKTLSSIGITTGTYQENGKLYLSDESKLREALEKEPEAVKALFTVDDDGAQHKGFAEKLYDITFNAISSISTKAGTSKYSSSDTFKLNADSLMGKELTSLDKEITNWNKRLVDIEDRYYKQFTAMETAINKYNSQSTYLSNSLK
ncbi:flagellar filament capping protein FliD [Gorillibacterium sp. sgz5001074]|uniref:flagellar filament capping protein FliD n=1 Tax=Gorillibacterium sp. sgz5001074 TaxID=3446695 RepID=UPI003F67F5BC